MFVVILCLFSGFFVFVLCVFVLALCNCAFWLSMFVLCLFVSLFGHFVLLDVCFVSFFNLIWSFLCHFVRFLACVSLFVFIFSVLCIFFCSVVTFESLNNLKTLKLDSVNHLYFVIVDISHEYILYSYTRPLTKTNVQFPVWC